MTDNDKLGAVFFDRDGVLNEDTSYLYKISDFRWIKGAKDALRAVQDAGLLSIVVTNQSGIGRGYFKEQDVNLLHKWMRHELSKEGVSIADFYICPFHEDAVVPRYKVVNHPDRKPNPGMILRAIQEWNLDPHKSFIVGDKESDLIAGHRAGIKGVIYQGGDLSLLIRSLLEM